MANRREEERERLRQARQERESGQDKSERRRLFAVYAGAGLIGLLVLAGVVALIAGSGGESEGNAHLLVSTGETNGFKPDEREGAEPAEAKTIDMKEAAKSAGCDLRLELKDEGHKHLPPTGPEPDYGTTPATSGNHAGSPYQQADGAYIEMPQELFVVHSLEHGRMAIEYSPDLPEEDQLELKGLYDTMFGGTLFFPNTNMDYEVAATTWTNLLGCEEYKGAATLDAIRAFGQETWGKYGGEPVNAFGLRGPTPAEPR
jgi:hypothetical protein